MSKVRSMSGHWFTNNLKGNHRLSKSLHDIIAFPSTSGYLNRSRMTSSNSQEESALLGSMPSDSMDDIELKNIQLQYPLARTLSKDSSVIVQEDRVETPYGTVLVASSAEKGKPAIITFHDIGLNHTSCFQSFFNFVDNKILLQSFSLYHINAPGQEENAENLPEDFEYPTMDKLSEIIGAVIEHFKLKRFIGFGVGAGANILCRYALAHPEQVDALILVNCVSTQAGWIEWGYQKLNTRHLKSKGMTQAAMDYMMWHHFGKVNEARNHDLMQVYKQYFEKSINPFNLGLFMESYVKRTDLQIIREMDPEKKKSTRMIRCPTMMITGNFSPHVDDTVTMNGRLDPANSNWMKVQDCGLVLEEQPSKVSEAIRLFLQGQGYAVVNTRRRYSTCLGEVPTLTQRKLNMSRKASIDEEFLSHAVRQEVRITENPINEHAVC